MKIWPVKKQALNLRRTHSNISVLSYTYSPLYLLSTINKYPSDAEAKAQTGIFIDFTLKKQHILQHIL
jgi:hypothetical protein